MNACLPFIDACVWYVIGLRSQAEIWRQNWDPTLVSEAQLQMLEVGKDSTMTEYVDVPLLHLCLSTFALADIEF